VYLNSLGSDLETDYYKTEEGLKPGKYVRELYLGVYRKYDLYYRTIRCSGNAV